MENKYLDKIRSSVENELRAFIAAQPVMEIGDENVALLDQVELALYPTLKTYLRTFNVNVFTITAENLDEDKSDDLGDHDFVISWGHTRHGEYVHVVKLGINPGYNITYHYGLSIIKAATALSKPANQAIEDIVKYSMVTISNKLPEYWQMYICDKDVSKLAHFKNGVDLLYLTLALKSVLSDKQFSALEIETLKDQNIAELVGSGFELTISCFNGTYMVVRK